MVDHLVAWDDVPSSDAPGGLTKRRIDLAAVSLVAVTVPAGAEAPRHSHGHEQFVQVLSGGGTLTTEQGTERFGPGSVFVFPAGTWHSARFDADTLLVETNLEPG